MKAYCFRFFSLHVPFILNAWYVLAIVTKVCIILSQSSRAANVSIECWFASGSHPAKKNNTHVEVTTYNLYFTNSSAVILKTSILRVIPLPTPHTPTHNFFFLFGKAYMTILDFLFLFLNRLKNIWNLNHLHEESAGYLSHVPWMTWKR